MADEATDTPGETGPIAEVLAAMNRVARQHQEESSQFRELAALGTPEQLLRHATHLMRRVVLDTAEVLRRRGYQINDDAWVILGALPLVHDQLRDQALREMSFGCADRARAVLTRMVTTPGAHIELTIHRPAYCEDDPTFCPEHGWGAHPSARSTDA